MGGGALSTTVEVLSIHLQLTLSFFGALQGVWRHTLPQVLHRRTGP